MWGANKLWSKWALALIVFTIWKFFFQKPHINHSIDNHENIHLNANAPTVLYPSLLIIKHQTVWQYTCYASTWAKLSSTSMLPRFSVSQQEKEINFPRKRNKYQVLLRHFFFSFCLSLCRKKTHSPHSDRTHVMLWDYVVNICICTNKLYCR